MNNSKRIQYFFITYIVSNNNPASFVFFLSERAVYLRIMRWDDPSLASVLGACLPMENEPLIIVRYAGTGTGIRMQIVFRFFVLGFWYMIYFLFSFKWIYKKRKRNYIFILYNQPSSKTHQEECIYVTMWRIKNCVLFLLYDFFLKSFIDLLSY